MEDYVKIKQLIICCFLVKQYFFIFKNFLQQNSILVVINFYLFGNKTFCHINFFLNFKPQNFRHLFKSVMFLKQRKLKHLRYSENLLFKFLSCWKCDFML